MLSNLRFILIWILVISVVLKLFFVIFNSSYFQVDEDSVWYLNHLRYRAEANYTDETKVNSFWIILSTVYIWKSPIRAFWISYITKIQVSYPIGRHSWKVTDRRCGSFGEAIAKPLTLTICKENEFTCDDGTCQPLENR